MVKYFVVSAWLCLLFSNTIIIFWGKETNVGLQNFTCTLWRKPFQIALNISYLRYDISPVFCNYMHVTCKDDKDKKNVLYRAELRLYKQYRDVYARVFLHEDVMTTVMNSTQTVIIIIFIWLINIKKFLYSFLDIKLW